MVIRHEEGARFGLWTMRDAARPRPAVALPAMPVRAASSEERQEPRPVRQGCQWGLVYSCWRRTGHQGRARTMGVFTDYFRAADAAAVRRVLAALDGGSPLMGPQAAFDGVEAKGLDPVVVLGQLIAAARQVPWSVDLVGETPVWPTTPRPGPDGPDDEDDPWLTGPWVDELDAATRDALAAIPDADVPAVAARWARAEELHGACAESLAPVVADFVGLARRARAAGDLLYCWTCL